MKVEAIWLLDMLGQAIVWQLIIILRNFEKNMERKAVDRETKGFLKLKFHKNAYDIYLE